MKHTHCSNPHLANKWLTHYVIKDLIHAESLLVENLS